MRVREIVYENRGMCVRVEEWVRVSEEVCMRMSVTKEVCVKKSED